jgi:hypothetical protein
MVPKIHLLLPVCSLVYSSVSGQTLTGQVRESERKPLPFANVLLLSSRDSSLVKGVISDEAGNYAIENVRPGTYLLLASMVGYQKLYAFSVTIAAGQTIQPVPPLMLLPETKQLSEVTVTAKRPFVEQQTDRIVVNVAGSIIASGSTVLEVLEKAPGVTVDRQNGAIALRSKDGVIVMIDGKQTHLAMADLVALLGSTPSDNIDHIDLITSPSAKYDAAGNAGIINIRLHKDNNTGTNGSLSVGGGSGRYDRQRSSVQVNHRAGKLNLFGNASASRGGNYFDFDLSRNQADGQLRNLIDQKSYIRLRERGGNVKAGADYFISKTTAIGVVWTGVWAGVREQSPAHTTFRREASGPLHLQTLTDKTLFRQSFNQVGNLNLQHSFGQKGGHVSADLDVGRFTRAFTNNLCTATLLSEEPVDERYGIHTRMPTRIDIVTVKADYSRPLPKNWRLEAGLKGSLVNSDNNMALSRGPLGELQPDSQLSNHFQYRERVKAFYTNFSGKIRGTTDFQLGLRAEQTHSVGKSLNLGKQVGRRYTNVFPTLSVSQPLSSEHRLTFSYSYRIDRPNYQNVNPAIAYLDPFSFTRGNPYLRPQLTHAVELKHGYKNTVFTSLGISNVGDYVFFLIQPVDHQKSERTPENIGKLQAYNLNLSFPVTVTRRWTLQASLQSVYSHLRYCYQGTPLLIRQVSGRLNGTSSVVLGKGWSAELTGWVSTPTTNAMFYQTWLGSIDAGIQKTFGLNWKANVSFQDVLHTNQIIAYGQAPDFSQNIRIGFDTRVVMLNLTHTFGNQQLKGMRQRQTGSEEEAQRTN